MKETIEQKNTEMGSVITRSEEFLEKNQKTIIYVLVAIIVVIVGIFAVSKWYVAPRQEHANDEIFAAEQWFATGQYELALDGNDEFVGLLSVIDNYGSTPAGNRAKYYAGCAYLHIGEYDEAIKWLKKYNGKDLFTPILAEMMIGDAYMELGDSDQALKHYNHAAKMDDNATTTPTALFKAGLVYIKNSNKDKALDCFNNIKDKYPESTEYTIVDKYIGVAESL